jgi:opacity protein-like surface antigen
MGSLKALVIAGFAGFAAIAPAAAADLSLPPPPPVEPGYVPVDFSGGFYLRGDVGEGNIQLRNAEQDIGNSTNFPNGVPNLHQNSASTDAEVIFGLGAGYQFNNYFRADVTGEYRSSGYHATETASGCNGLPAGCADQYGATFHSAVFLLNGYVDLGTWYNVTPYIGAGVGASLNNFGGITDYNLAFYGLNSGYAPSKTTTDLAYALMAGFSYSLTPNLKLDIGYRYLDMGRIASNPIVCTNAPCPLETQHYHLSSNDIRLGLRYVFNEAPPPRAFPIIEKY